MRTRALIASLAVLAVVAAVPVATQLRPDDKRLAPVSASPAVADECALTGLDVKEPLHGLLTIGGPPDDADRSLVSGFSVNVPWRDLQPVSGGQLVRPNEIDAAIAAIKATRGSSCAPGLKLRLRAGTAAPDWVKRLGGQPVQLTLALDHRSGSVPRFWRAEVGAAYAQLQELLAAAYDGVPEVREVVMSRCMTFYAEPLLRQPADGLNAAHLRAAGLTESRDRVCLAEQTRAHLVWQRTPSSLALNPYDALDGTGPPTLDMALEAARGCRAVLGQRCILANNSIRWPVLGGKYPDLYAALDELGSPLEYQTAAPQRVGDLVSTVGWAFEHRAGSVELEPAVLATVRDDLAALIPDS